RIAGFAGRGPADRPPPGTVIAPAGRAPSSGCEVLAGSTSDRFRPLVGRAQLGPVGVRLFEVIRDDLLLLGDRVAGDAREPGGGARVGAACAGGTRDAPRLRGARGAGAALEPVGEALVHLGALRFRDGLV